MFWVCILIASIIAMAAISVYTINDYLESPVVINVQTTISDKNNVFPAISVCIKRAHYSIVSSKSVKKFVQKYYAEHKIAEPQQ